MKKLLAIILTLVCVLSFAGCNSNNPSGEKGQNIKDFANYETLAYSLNRIANADVSFNFSMGDGSKTVKPSDEKSTDEKLNEGNVKTNATKTTSTKVKLLADSNQPQGEIMEFSVDEIQKIDEFDYFAGMEMQLESQRSYARSVVDNALRNITVLDTAIVADNELSVLSYDKANNSVYTIFKTPSETHEISFYYDSLGKETVEMTTISNITGEGENGMSSVTKLKYTPDEYYYIGNYQYGMVNVAMATKVDGEWQGIAYYFYETNPFLTKSGTYDYGNGQVLVSFLVEKNGVFFTFTDFLDAYRNGERQGSQVEAQANDEIKLRQYMFNSSFVSFDYFNDSIDFSYNSFDGIDKAHISLDAEIGPSVQPELIHFYYDSAKDYLLLDNGDKIQTYAEWKNATGKAVVLCGGEAYLTKNENYALYPGYPLCFKIDGETITNKLSTFKEFMQAKGLTVSKFFSDSVIDDLCLIEQNNETYRGKLFKKLFNKDYSEKSVIDEMLSNLTEFSAIESDLIAKINAYETMNFEDMPKLNSRPNLISITASESKASVNENGVDLSGISINVDKNILLESGSTYALRITFDNKTYSTSAFNTVEFADSQMTFTGKILNDFISLDEGVYSLKVCFGKYVSETDFIPLSNEITVGLNTFSDYKFSTENDETLGGHYEFTYSFENGNVKVSKQLIKN